MIKNSDFKKIQENLISSYQYYDLWISSLYRPKGSKRVYIELEDLIPNRYLYNFLKFFKICGYTIYLPKNRSFIARLAKKRGEFRYSSWILREDVKLGKPKEPFLYLNRERLSNAYFNEIMEKNSFHVPMSEYPLFYFKELPFPENKKAMDRKNSVFMSGNMDKRYYDKLSNSPFFSIPSRLGVYDFLKQNSGLYYKIESYDDLTNFLQGDLTKRLIIIDCTEDFRIPLGQVKSILVSFNFYLALPGMVMPQCHNVIEAMSVGCIPIIHSTYAETFTPGLKHHFNAMIYKSIDDLEMMIDEAMELNPEIIQKMQNNVLRYYSENLSPYGVVGKIENNHFSKIYIQAEIESLKLLKYYA